MSDRRTILPESPMMKRVERAGGAKGFSPFGVRLHLPKKGRIRLALFLIIIVAVVKIFSNREPADKTIARQGPPPEPAKREMSPPAAAPVAVSAAAKAEPVDQPHASLLGRLGLFKPEIRDGNFSAADLVDLLRKHPPHLKAVADTIVSDNRTYILHYSFDSTVGRCGQTLLKQYHPKYGALVAMDAATGRVLALVSYTRDSEPPLGDNLFARSLFPMASVFKTVTASAAIEKANMNPDSKLPLAGRRYTLYRFQLKEDLAAYEPVSLQDAYAYSINPIFGRIGVYVLGPSVIREYMGKFGFNCQIPFELDNEKPVATIGDKDSALLVAEIASGFNQKTRMSPLFGAMLAASVSQNGKMPAPFFVDSVTCGDSCVIYRAVPRVWRSPVREATADLLKGMMSRVAQYGTARSSFRYIKHSACFDNIDYGGKTGTVDEDKLGKIDWFIGFASNPADARQRIAVGVVTVHDQFWTVHSSYIAAEIFRKYIRQSQISEKATRVERVEAQRVKAEG
jgi:membrane peptidoglycan carboxypeptidase